MSARNNRPQGTERPHHAGPWLEPRLRQDVLDGKVVVGGKLFSCERLAMLYGVDKMTANRVVQSLAREGLLRVQRGSGTFLNVPRQTCKAGLLYFHRIKSLAGQGVYGEIAREVQLHLKKAGYVCEVMGRDEADAESVHGPSVGSVTAKGFDLLVTIGIMSKTYFQQLLWLDVPIVAVDFAPGLDRVASVSVDSFNLGYDAARMLLDRGHRRFLFVPYFRRLPGQGGFYREHDSYLEESGWRYALGLAGDGVSCHYMAAGTHEEALFREELERLCAGTERPTAAFGSGHCNRLCAVLHEQGLKVPRDISVMWVGWETVEVDGIRIAAYDVDGREMAKATVNILQGYTERKGVGARHVMVNSRFHPGDSIRSVRPGSPPPRPRRRSETRRASPGGLQGGANA